MRRLDGLRVLEVRHECRTNLLEQGLELRVLRVGDQSFVEGIEDGLMVGDLVVDIGLVEGRAAQALRASQCSRRPPALSCLLASLSSGVTLSFVARATACLFTPP